MTAGWVFGNGLVYGFAGGCGALPAEGWRGYFCAQKRARRVCWRALEDGNIKTGLCTYFVTVRAAERDNGKNVFDLLGAF